MPTAPGAVSDDLLADLIPSRIDALVAAIDRRIGRQLDEILHHPRFQAMERAWRGLWFVVERTDFTQNVQLEIWDCPKRELAEDLEDSAGDRSALHALVYAAAYERADGVPYGAVIADLDIGPDPGDLALLRRAALVGLRALCPFVAGAAPGLLALRSFADLPREGLAAHRAELAAGLARWARLRETEEARAAGLALPRFLLRAPHVVTEPFAYVESAEAHEDRCWGRASLAFATRLAHSFALYRWCPNIVRRGAGGDVGDLPGAGAGGPVEVALDERAERELADLGFVPLVQTSETGACFLSARSVQAPARFDDTEEGRAAAMNARLGAELPHFLLLTRVMQHLKLVYRSRDEAWNGREDTEKELNDWIGQYVADRDVVSSAVRSRRMLRKARILVKDTEDEAGWYRLVLQIRPHFKHMGAFFTLALENRLEKDGA